MLILTGFRANPRGPKSGQGKLADLDTLIQGHSPTFGSITLFFFQKSTTRSYYLMNFSQASMRGAEIWHIWKQHHLIECFWKMLKSIFHIRAMQLQGHGLYTALLIKVF